MTELLQLPLYNQRLSNQHNMGTDGRQKSNGQASVTSHCFLDVTRGMFVTEHIGMPFWEFFVSMMQAGTAF
jgi:hypothetical protein